MTDSEVAEMLRRDALGDRMSRVVALISGVEFEQIPEGTYPEYGPNFGGIWQDQLDGGKIVIALVDPSLVDLHRVSALLGGREHFRVVTQAFSYDQIELFRSLLDARLEQLGIGRDIAAVRGDRGRLLEVRVENPAVLPEDFGDDVPRGAFSVVAGSVMRHAGFPTTTHSLSDQQPGIETWVRAGPGCTWGTNGHTATYHYIVEAGHCLPPPYDNLANGQWVGSSIEIDQNGDTSRNLTPGDTFIVSQNDSNWDASRIESPYADDNCYHGDTNLTSPPPHCAWPIAHRAIHNSWEIGSDRTCASLGNVASNTYRCGFILEENHVGGNRVRVGMVVHEGDSGAGMKWEYRLDGILTDLSETEAFFQTAYHVLVALGTTFDFNCYSPGSIVRSNPADWGSCPLVDA